MTDIIREFNSWHQFVAQATDASRRVWALGNQESQEDCSDNKSQRKWYGTATFADAAELARVGWPHGKKQLFKAIVQTRPSYGRVARIRYDVAGERPDIMRAVAGDPMSMVTRAKSIKARKPVIRVDMHFMCSAFVTPEQLLLRGAALLSIVDSLENNGASVELRLLAKARMSGDSITMRVPYKLAGEALDLSRAAYAMLHPAILRRFGFAIYEQHKEIEESLCGSYGMPTAAGLAEEGVIQIEAPSSGDYQTPEQAYEQVSAHFSDYLAG